LFNCLELSCFDCSEFTSLLDGGESLVREKFTQQTNKMKPNTANPTFRL
jgi:hypothetical protein